MALDAFLHRQHQAEIGKKIKQKLGGTFNYYVLSSLVRTGSILVAPSTLQNVQKLNSTPCPPTTTTFTPTLQKTVKSVILWFYNQLSSAPVNTTKNVRVQIVLIIKGGLRILFPILTKFKRID